MKNLTVLAAALVAGLTTFAVDAKEVSKSDVSKAATKAESTVTASRKEDSSHRAGERGKTGEEIFHGAKAAAAAAETTRAGKKADAEEAKAKKADKPFAPLIERYASMNGVSPELVHAVIQVESNYKPNSKGRAGEIGLMQIKPATARMMGYSGSTRGLFDPETNIKYGLKYLAKAQKLGGGSTCGTILKYNAGHGAKRMNPISSAYCKKVKKRLAGI